MKKIICLCLVLLIFAGCMPEIKENEDTATSTATMASTPISTEVSTPTPEPTPEPIPEPTPVPVTVEDAVNYKKKIVADPYVYGSSTEDIGNHEIVIPKIVDEGEAVKALNAKIYNVMGKEYEELLNNQERHMIYFCEYMYTDYNGIIGIILRSICCPQGSGGGSEYHAFYYDSVNKKELTFYEYYSLLGYHTKSELWENIKKTPEYIEYYEEYDNGYYELIYAIMDDKKAHIVFDMPDSLDGVMDFEVKANLIK